MCILSLAAVCRLTRSLSVSDEHVAHDIIAQEVDAIPLDRNIFEVPRKIFVFKHVRVVPLLSHAHIETINV